MGPQANKLPTNVRVPVKHDTSSLRFTLSYAFLLRIMMYKWSRGLPQQFCIISFHHVQACWLEDGAFNVLNGFLANNKANVTPRLEGAVVTGCWKAVCLLFMKVPPQETAFNYFWKFIMVWLLCCEIVVSLVMAKWEIWSRNFARLVPWGRARGEKSFGSSAFGGWLILPTLLAVQQEGG